MAPEEQQVAEEADRSVPEDRAGEVGVDSTGVQPDVGPGILGPEDGSAGTRADRPVEAGPYAAAAPSDTDLLDRVAKVSLVGVFVIMLVSVLYIAQAVFLPIIVAIVLNYVLAPVVRALTRVGIPKGVGAGIVLVFLSGLFVFALVQLSTPASFWIRNAAERADELEQKLSFVTAGYDRIKEMEQTVNEATSESADPDGGDRLLKVQAVAIDAATGGLATGSEAALAESDAEVADEGEAPAADAPPPPPPAGPVPQGYDVVGTILSTTGTALANLASIAILLYFLLASGNHFLRRWVGVMPDPERKRQVIELNHAVEEGVSSYLLAVCCINAALGACIGILLWLIGLPNPFFWGALAATVNFVPFVGLFLGVTLATMAALLQFDSLAYAMLVPAAYLACNLLEGNFITPMILGYRLNLHPAVLILALMLFGWLWGLVGAIIAIPLLAVAKIWCEHIEPLKPVAEMMSGTVAPPQFRPQDD